MILNYSFLCHPRFLFSGTVVFRSKKYAAVTLQRRLPSISWASVQSDVDFTVD